MRKTNGQFLGLGKIKKVASGASQKYMKERRKHEARQMVRNLEKAGVYKTRAELEEAKARVRLAKKAGKGKSNRKMASGRGKGITLSQIFKGLRK